MRMHISVHVHLQHFQSQRSYCAHALSSVAKSSLTQLNMVVVDYEKASQLFVEKELDKRSVMKSEELSGWW